MISLSRWEKVEDLRAKLNGRAKAEPKFRFYSLYDKVYRMDFLEAAYAQCRANDGAPGVDGETFADIEARGVGAYLAELSHELKELRYRPQAVRRVMIPKEGQPGKFRPLGIPTIRDRIVQQSVKLLLEPIFEADFTDNAYGYRPGKSALDAIQEVERGLRNRQVNVVDGDLSKYFDTIPHDELMRSVERRQADHKVLWLIRRWLKAPVQERSERGKVTIGGGKSTRVGTPQGGVISPLLANIYFRRFLVAWERFGYDRKYQSRIVNYADDFVILCRHSAQAAQARAQELLERIGLTLNTTKTRVVRAWQTSFDFLGYTFGVIRTKNGRECLGKKPSQKSQQRYRDRVRELTAAKQTCKRPETVAAALKALTQGFWGYFGAGATHDARHALDDYQDERMLKWAQRKYRRSRGKKGKTGPEEGQRWEQIGAAMRMVVRSTELKNPGGERHLFANAASYAQ